MDLIQFTIVFIIVVFVLLSVQIIVFNQVSTIMRNLKTEVAELKLENKYLNDAVNEFKNLVAVMIAETDTSERDRIVKMAKNRLKPDSLSLFRKGHIKLGLSQLESEVNEDQIDEVIALQGRFAGLSKSMDHNRISASHFEIEVNNIRAAAIEIALAAQKQKNGQ